MNHKVPKRKNIFEAFYNKVSKPFSKLFLLTKFTANQITIISGFFGIMGAYYLTLESRMDLIYAAIFIQVYTILDLVDGDIARSKNMQSIFGQFLDVTFDKLNDLLIILGLSLGVFLRTNDYNALVLGIILMGSTFYIQFLMIFESQINISNNTDQNYNKSRPLISNNQNSIYVFIKFILKHFLTGHSTLLFFISFFIFIDEIIFGLYFLTIHAFITLSIMIILGLFRYYKI